MENIHNAFVIKDILHIIYIVKLPNLYNIEPKLVFGTTSLFRLTYFRVTLFHRNALPIINGMRFYCTYIVGRQNHVTLNIYHE